MQQGRFRRDGMMIHRPGAQPHGCVPTLITRGVDQFCLAGMVWFWKAPKYLTGVWENVPDGDIYHGAFQFVVSPDGKRMTGKWIGFNRKQEIREGPWQWNLVSRSANRKAKR